MFDQYLDHEMISNGLVITVIYCTSVFCHKRTSFVMYIWRVHMISETPEMYVAVCYLLRM